MIRNYTSEFFDVEAIMNYCYANRIDCIRRKLYALDIEVITVYSQDDANFWHLYADIEKLRK